MKSKYQIKFGKAADGTVVAYVSDGTTSVVSSSWHGRAITNGPVTLTPVSAGGIPTGEPRVVAQAFLPS